MDDPILDRIKERREAREQAERSFELGGETLRVRSDVAPEAVRRYRDAQMTVYEDIERQRKWREDREKAEAANGGAPLEEFEEEPEGRISDDEIIAIADETILACLDVDCHDAWARLRSPEHPHPLSWIDVYELVPYVISRITQLPTDAPTDSSDGRTETDKSSKAASSSPAKTPAASV